MRRLVLLAALGFLLSNPSIAAAQPGLTNPQNPDDEIPAQRGPVQPGYRYEAPAPYAYAFPPPRAPEVKSEGTATALSIGTMAAGFAMLGAAAGSRNGDALITGGLLAIMIGPSAGHIYAGETGHAVKMSLLRTGAFVAFIAGVVQATTATACFEGPCADSSNDGATLMWAGGLTFVAATVYDIVDASRAARRRNEKSRMYMIAPSYAQTSSGAVPGLAVSGRF